MWSNLRPILHKPAHLTISINFRMRKVSLFLLILVALTVLGPECKSDSGSREFIPGKGWVPNKTAMLKAAICVRLTPAPLPLN
jgi:hypothetical protein